MVEFCKEKHLNSVADDIDDAWLGEESEPDVVAAK